MDDDRLAYPDLGRMLRLLHARDEAQIRKVLRRLRLRWYHASATPLMYYCVLHSSVWTPLIYDCILYSYRLTPLIYDCIIYLYFQHI